MNLLSITLLASPEANTDQPRAVSPQMKPGETIAVRDFREALRELDLAVERLGLSVSPRPDSRPSIQIH